jgi:hypothetical protein
VAKPSLEGIVLPGADGAEPSSERMSQRTLRAKRGRGKRAATSRAPRTSQTKKSLKKKTNSAESDQEDHPFLEYGWNLNYDNFYQLILHQDSKAKDFDLAVPEEAM